MFASNLYRRRVTSSGHVTRRVWALCICMCVCVCVCVLVCLHVRAVLLVSVC